MLRRVASGVADAICSKVASGGHRNRRGCVPEIPRLTCIKVGDW
jgi:hypothetical protein